MNASPADLLKRIIIIVCLMAFISPSLIAQESSILEEDAAIKNLLEIAIEEAGAEGIAIPGMVAAIRVHDQPVRIAAMGVRKVDDEAPITLHDQMHLGSCTKAMTAALVGRLIDQEKLTMEMTIGELLPEIASEIHEDYSAVTLRQLLEHQSGLPDTMMWWLQEGDTITETRRLIVIKALADKPEHEPGTNFEYANLNYAVVGLMCGAVTGQPWEELMQQEIFDPLGLASAGFGHPGETNEVEQPWGHNVIGRDGELRASQIDNAPTLGPAGTVHMSLSDWSTFLLEMTDHAPAGLLSEETRAMLTTPSSVDAEVPAACGWFVTQRGWADGKAIWHNGSNTRWFALTWVSTSKGHAYMVVINAMSPGMPQLADELISKLIGIQAEADR
ncbi:MAG: serine hydrolase domain-containing protein [Planctomycetota bacterium]